MVLEVEEPRFVVDAAGNLNEAGEIMDAKVELVLRPSKIEDSLLFEFTLGVFAFVPFMSLAGRDAPDMDNVAASQKPNQALARGKSVSASRGGSRRVASQNS
ncbi:MAG: hypothetical protein WDO73_05450 [Ignavibacteriota bacterium]